MHILNFIAQRTKNLKVVEIDSEGRNIIPLSGRNGQGKSNILEVIKSTLTGERLVDPILHGENTANSEVDCGEFKVKKVWTEKGERIQVIMANGDIKSKPMEFLGSVVGNISFDPTEFSNMKPKEQRELLKKLVGLDFSDIEKEYTENFNSRTLINSSIKGVIAQLENAEAPDPKTTDEEVTFKDELEKLSQLREKRKSFLDAVEDKQELLISSNEKNDFILKKLEEIKKLKEEIEKLEIEKDEALKRSEEVVLPVEVKDEDITSVESSLNDIEAKNVTIREAKRYRDLVRQSNKLKKDSDAYTEKLNRLNQDKSTRIANAKFPIEGMSMDDEEIMYKGNRFTILSDGQKMRVCTAISMALNPTLKVIFIRHANDLDKEGKKAICDMAKAQDYQVWMEVVAEEAGEGFFIEMGEITNVDGVEVSKPVEAN